MSHQTLDRGAFVAASFATRFATALKLVRQHGNILAAATSSGIDRRQLRRVLLEGGVPIRRGVHAIVAVEEYDARVAGGRRTPASPADSASTGAADDSAPTTPLEPSVEAFLRSEVARLNRELNASLRASGADTEATRVIRESVETIRPIPLVTRPSEPGKSTVDMVVHLTDWHYGQVQPAGEVEGFGEFSPELAHERVTRLAELLRDKAELTSRAYNIRDIHVLCTGDFISGDIHRELSITNAMPAPQQAVGVGNLLAEFVVYMRTLPCEDVRVHYLTLDNHSRLTKKPQSAQGGINSWGLIVSEVAKARLIHYPGVEYNQHTSPSMLVTVGSERYLCLHGHQIRGWMGKPYYGFDRRAALEAMRRLNRADQTFTRMVLGHFHSAALGDYWTLGGSLSGTTAYDHSCGRHAEPHQTSWLVHPVHGEFDFTRWWLGRG